MLELRISWTMLLLLALRSLGIATSNSRLRTRPATFDDYECSSSSSPFPEHNFTATVFVVLEGPTKESQFDLMRLVGDVFLESYNGLIFQLCDAPLFRRIIRARASALPLVDDDSMHVVSSYDEASNHTTILQLDVTTECRGNSCTPSTPLFDPTWSLKMNSADNNYYRAPTAAQEFSVLFQEALQQEILASHSDLDPPTLMIQLVEEEQRIDCSRNPWKTFSTSYSIVGLALKLNTTVVANVDADALLGEVFAETFNELTNLSCDKHYRSVASASVRSKSVDDDDDDDDDEEEEEQSAGGTRQLAATPYYQWDRNYTTLLQNQTNSTRTSNSTETTTEPPQTTNQSPMSKLPNK